MSLENDLKQIGLEEKEAKVYLAALELGATNIQNLTKKSEIKRSTVYEMLKNLKSMGLISETTKGKRKIFVASEPENLKRNIVAKEKLLNEMLPELKSISNIGFIKPKITFYEGRDGLREIYRKTLETKSKLALWISPVQDIFETVGEDFLIKYIKERSKKEIWIKSVHVTLKNVSDYKLLSPDTHEKTFRKVRFTPLGINISNTVAIWDNKTAIINSRKEGLGFIIESEDYANMMKTFHELLWSISKSWHEMDFDKTSQTAENSETEEKEDKYWSVKK